jgi:2-polyprenyl-3-methyl-5-hydroxy-6-metoxy-1,4-benzoquinol methylase
LLTGEQRIVYYSRSITTAAAEEQAMTTAEIDTAKAEAFGGQMMGVVNNGMLALMLSVGHQTGLFDTMASLPPSTSHEIAKAGGLNERYVREWLGVMVTGGVVEYAAARHAYRLPPEHAASLTRAAGPGNLANMTQFIALLGDVEADLVGCFRNGGGVPYARFPRFQRLMAEMSATNYDANLVNVTLPLVPGLVARLHEGVDVADVGCGSGHAINVMAKAFPKSRFTGIDFSEEGIAAGRNEAKSLGLSNATFELKDAATLSGPARFDFITTFDSVHDQAHPDRMLDGIAAALRPGGAYLCVDVAASSNLEENLEHPLGPMMYAVSTAHCMTVSLALGGMGLGAMWGEQKAHEMITAAGFKKIETAHVEGDFFNNYYIATR